MIGAFWWHCGRSSHSEGIGGDPIAGGLIAKSVSAAARLEPRYLPSAGRAGTASTAGWNGGGKAGGQIRPRLDRFQSTEIALHTESRTGGEGFCGSAASASSRIRCAVYLISTMKGIARCRRLGRVAASPPACGSRLARVIGACNALGGPAALPALPVVAPHPEAPGRQEGWCGMPCRRCVAARALGV